MDCGLMWCFYQTLILTAPIHWCRDTFEENSNIKRIIIITLTVTAALRQTVMELQTDGADADAGFHGNSGRGEDTWAGWSSAVLRFAPVRDYLTTPTLNIMQSTEIIYLSQKSFVFCSSFIYIRTKPNTAQYL